MKGNQFINSLACFFTLFLISSQSSALMIALSTEKLTQGSKMVIRGEVEEVESQWSEDKEIIFTRATVLVNSVFKGLCLEKRIIVEYIGGKVGDMGLGVSDSPRITEGEEVILFLTSERSKKGREHGFVYNIFGAAQGKYAIGNDGFARKGGFSILKRKNAEKGIDNNIPVDELIGRIKKID